MDSGSPYNRLLRVIAFFWGFALIHLFKYTLDNIYPIWNETLSLSFFAYTVIFLIWMAYALSSFLQPKNSKWIKLALPAVFLANASIFLFTVLTTGADHYLFAHTPLFNFQLLIFVFLFTCTLPSVLKFRISLLAGTVTGLLSYPYVGSIYVEILLPAVVFISVTFLKFERAVIKEKSALRMAALRESLDFLRFFFLVLAFYGAFDIFREHFYLTVFIVSIGPFLSTLLHRIDSKKHHVKYGMIFLGLFFIGLILVSNLIHINYSSAIGFSFITIWEGIYFKKLTEGYLDREKVLSGFALVIGFFFYKISVEWVFIISSAILILAQVRILNYISKGYRKTMAAIFLLSLAGWTYSLYYNYDKSYKRDFWVPLKNEKTVFPPNLAILDSFNDPHKKYYTNLFPEDIIKKAEKDFHLKIFYNKLISPILTWEIRYYSRDPKVIQIYSIENLKAYDSKNSFQILLDYLKETGIENVRFFNPQTNEFRDENPRKLPALNSVFSNEQKIEFAKDLASWYKEKSKFEEAISIYKNLLEFYQDTSVFRSLANIYGITGDTASQIEYREKVFQRPDAFLEDKTLLMELYFLSGNLPRALDICEMLIQTDKDNTLTYLEWKFKIIRQKKNRYQLELLRNTVMYLPNLSNEKIPQRDNLLNKINEDLKNIPLWDEIYNAEKKRQENIIYPE